MRWVFSDKTGTLTENRMDFAKCSIHGQVLDVGDSDAIEQAMRTAPEKARQPSQSKHSKKSNKKKRTELLAR